MRYDSKIAGILETISEEITTNDIFEGTPIFYDFIEVDANNLPPACIVYKPLEWRMDKSNCNYERQLDIVILITEEERREGVVGQLFMFGEKMKKVMDNVSMKINGIDFLQGSPVTGFAYNRKGRNSYKETPDVFTSMIVLSYLIRY